MINKDIWKRSRVSSFPTPFSSGSMNLNSTNSHDYFNAFNAFSDFNATPDLVFQRTQSGVSTVSNSTVESDAPIAREIRSCKLRITHGRFTISFFENLNRDIDALIYIKTPTLESRKKHELLLKCLQESLQYFMPNCTLDHFNSSINSNSFLEVDMDIIISVSSNYSIPLESINLIAHGAKTAGLKEIKIPVKSRIPLITGIDSFTGFKVDLRLDSTSSIKLHQMFRIYALLNPRFEQLLLIVKYWFSKRIYSEKAYGIIPRSIYIYLVLFLCQQRGVLPILQGDSDCYSDYDWTSKNSESLGELLVAFFKYYSSDFPYVHGVLSIRTGNILTKESKGWTKENHHLVNQRGIKDRYWFCIEHPFNIYHNVATTIDKETLYEIRGEFIRASKIICGSIGDSDEGILNLILQS